jgi:hypothetical protein
MPQVGQLFSYKIIFLEVRLEPSINFYGKTTYTDINAILGLRYQSRTKQQTKTKKANLYNKFAFFITI